MNSARAPGTRRCSPHSWPRHGPNGPCRPFISKYSPASADGVSSPRPWPWARSGAGTTNRWSTPASSTCATTSTSTTSNARRAFHNPARPTATIKTSGQRGKAMKRLPAMLLAGASWLALSAVPAQADQSCSTVKLADPGWSDIAVTNGITAFLLDGMGYQPKIDTLAVPIIFGGLKDGLVDVFLGNWMPAQQGFYDKFVASGEVTQLAKNLQGTEFTLAVPSYVYEAGVQSFADLNKYAEQFDQKIYGIGAGAPANLSLQAIIKKNEFELGTWKLVESGEQAMLSEVARAVKRERFIVFLLLT